MAVNVSIYVTRAVVVGALANRRRHAANLHVPRLSRGANHLSMLLTARHTHELHRCVFSDFLPWLQIPGLKLSLNPCLKTKLISALV